MNTCRICKSTDESIALKFKYGTRHYACGRCGIQKWGVGFLDMIPQHEIGRLPYFALKEQSGLLAEAKRRTKEAA